MVRFRANEPNVVFETFDEEIVLVNLDTGNYYSVRGAGPVLWLALKDGMSVPEIVERLRSEGAAAPDLEAQIEAFANQLVAADLLVKNADGAARGGAMPPLPDGFAYEAPNLEAYDDMQDLLMLDPVHDVDAAGWPVAKEN